MEYREIGNSGIKVSSICLGTMNFSNPVNHQDSIKMLHWSLDHGINFIDTADIYEGYDRVLGSPGGKAELIIGDGLKNKRHHWSKSYINKSSYYLHKSTKQSSENL